MKIDNYNAEEIKEISNENDFLSGRNKEKQTNLQFITFSRAGLGLRSERKSNIRIRRYFENNSTTKTEHSRIKHGRNDKNPPADEMSNQRGNFYSVHPAYVTARTTERER